MTNTKPQLICRVAETFLIKGRGVVLCPDASIPDGVVLRNGDPVTLRTPEGRTLETRIKALELITPNPKDIVPMMLEAVREKSDAPIGSEVWTRPGLAL